MQEIDFYPFQQPDFKAGESEDKNILAYDAANMVVKQDKRLLNGAETTSSFATIDYVLRRARLDKETIERLRETLKEMGANTKPLDLALKTEYVVHKTPQGENIYTEAQPLVRDYEHLSDLGWRVFGLPKATLQDLAGIYRAVYETAKSNDYTIDLAGSPPRSTNILRKVMRHLFPMVSSLNIVIDAENQAHFIDVGRFEDSNPQGNSFGLRRKIQIAGAWIGYISTKTALMFRK